MTRTFVVALLAMAAPAAGQTATADSAGIRAAARDYVESWYAGDAERMERCLHPELAKRIVTVDAQGKSRLDHMGALRLVQATRAGYGTRTPADRQVRDVVILDIFGNAASVRAEMAGWVDYMHLARWDGRWVIVNVLWERKPSDD